MSPRPIQKLVLAASLTVVAVLHFGIGKISSDTERQIEKPVVSYEATGMSFFLHPFQVVAVIFAEWVRREQEKVIDYLQAEAKVLREPWFP